MVKTPVFFFVSLFCFCLSPIAQAQPVVSAAVNAASNQPLLAPGCWMSIYGTSLAPETTQAAAVPLPALLSGVSVSVGGVAAPLLFVSPNQINALVPFEVAGTGPAGTASLAVTVTSGQATSAPHYILVSPAAPALYTRDMTGAGRAIFLSPAFQLLDAVAPADTVIVYAAGLGQTDPPATSNAGGAATEPFNRVIPSAIPEVYIGDQQATVLFAGLAPGFPGVYQLNLQVPAGLSSDRVYLRAGQLQSNIAQIGIPAGQNATNMSGTINGLFPSDGSDPAYPATYPFDTSLMPQVTAFTVAMDIPPNANPFVILAVGESGSSDIQVNPSKGTWQATNTVLLAPVRFGDYSALGITLWDYRTCQITTGVLCTPFPTSMVPASRIDPGLARAVNQLAMPNAAVGGGIGAFVSAGSVPDGGHLVFDAQTTPGVTVFGGLAPIPLGYLDTRIAPLRLYVDGKLIAFRDLSYKVVPRPQ